MASTTSMVMVIAKLWSAVYDLIFLYKGTGDKTLEEIEADLDVIEQLCRPYAELCDADPNQRWPP